MAKLINPLDDPDFVPGASMPPSTGAQQPRPANPSGLVNPMDDPEFMQGLQQGRQGAGLSGTVAPPTDEERFARQYRESGGAPVDRFLGEGVEEYPELTSAETGGLPLGSKIRTAAGLMFTPEEDAADIAKLNIPGSEIETTLNGDKVLVVPEGSEAAAQYGVPPGKYFVNRPGPSAQDAFNVAGLGLAFTPAGRLAARGLTMASRAARGGVAAGATQAGLEAGAQGLGSEQPVSLERVGGAAVGGALGEVVAPIFKLVANRIKSSDLAGEVSAAVKKTFSDVGVDYDNLAPSVKTELRKLLTQSERQNRIQAREATAAAAEATERATQIPLTKGQRTGDLGQIATEQDMATVGRGARAANVMQEFFEKQTEAISRAAMRLQERVAKGGRVIAGDDEAGGTIVEGVRNAAATARREIDDAYEAANLADPDLKLESLEGFAKTVMSGLRTGGRIVDPQLTPATMKALRLVRKLQRIGGRKGALRPVALQRVEVLRRQLNKLIDAGANKSDMGNVIAIKSSLDDWLDGAVDNALLSGDEEALDLLKAARSKRADFGRKFEAQKGQPDRDAGRLIERIQNEDVTNVQAADFALGRSAIGENATSVRTLRRLKDVLGEDSDQWQSVRQAAFRRILFGAKEKGREEISRKKIVSAIDAALDGRGQQVIGELFDADEIAEMRTFRDAVAKTITPDIAQNPSRTGSAVSRLMADAFKKLALFSGDLSTAVAMQAAQSAKPAMAARAARKATRGPLSLPPPRAIRLTIQPATVGGAAGGYLSGESVGDQGSEPGQ